MRLIPNRRAIIGLIIVAITCFALGSLAKGKYDHSNVLDDLSVFAKVIEKVQSYYVDDIDTHELITGAIEDMLKELDPHSQFLSGLDYEDLMLSTQGQFGGLGIYISFRDNYPTVISPIEGTPASRAGIQSGDRIIEIETESAEGWQVQRAVRYLRGEPGSAVSFKVHRPGLEDPIEYSLVREKIEVKSVTYSGTHDDVGYVKLANFSKNTREELEESLRSLEDQDVKGIVLDLRWNPGGLLQAATGVSELFLDRDKLIVYTKGRYSQNNHKYYASKSRKFKSVPIVVMVNGASASASEIVAGAIQDWDAGVVVGQTSFGKGTVQTVFTLSDSQAVKLTTAKYYTPSGRSIHKDHTKEETANVTAGTEGDGDEGVSGVDELSMGEAQEGIEIPTANQPIFHTSSGRVVYGGGGIAPDIEFEPATIGEFERRLERDGVFFSFAVEYSTQNDVSRDFEATDAVVAEFRQTLVDREFEFTDEDFTDESDAYIRRAIVREVVSKEFGRKEMYRRMLYYDPEFTEVLELFRESPGLDSMFKYAEEHRAMKKASLE